MSGIMVNIWTLLAWVSIDAVLLAVIFGIYRIRRQGMPKTFPITAAFVLVSAAFILPRCMCIDVWQRVQGDTAAFTVYAVIAFIVVAVALRVGHRPKAACL